MDYHDHPFWTERFESEAELRESNALTFDVSDIECPEDAEVVSLAMERDMAERERCWQYEAETQRLYIRELEQRVRELSGEDEDDGIAGCLAIV